MRASEPHPEVIILDVDEKSLARLGQWPWPRDTVASLINKLFDPVSGGVKALGLDFLLAEPDPRPHADAYLGESDSGSSCRTELGAFSSQRSR